MSRRFESTLKSGDWVMAIDNAGLLKHGVLMSRACGNDIRRRAEKLNDV